MLYRRICIQVCQAAVNGYVFVDSVAYPSDIVSLKERLRGGAYESGWRHRGRRTILSRYELVLIYSLCGG